MNPRVLITSDGVRWTLTTTRKGSIILEFDCGTLFWTSFTPPEARTLAHLLAHAAAYAENLPMSRRHKAALGYLTSGTSKPFNLKREARQASPRSRTRTNSKKNV
jgi:hypothetical protein